MTRALDESADDLKVVQEPKTLPDLLCEPGQLYGPLQPKSLAKIFGRPDAGVAFGSAAASRVELVCGIEPDKHVAVLKLVSLGSPKEAILVEIPEHGPCEGHGEGTWHFNLKVTFEDESERTSGPLHVRTYWDEKERKEHSGYPRVPTVPEGPSPQ